MTKLDHLLDDEDMDGYFREKAKVIREYESHRKSCVEAIANRTAEPMWPRSLYGYTEKDCWPLTF